MSSYTEVLMRVPAPLQLRRLRSDNRGQDLIEYAMLAAFVTTVAAVVFNVDLLPPLTTLWERVNRVLHSIGGA